MSDIYRGRGGGGRKTWHLTINFPRMESTRTNYKLPPPEGRLKCQQEKKMVRVPPANKWWDAKWKPQYKYCTHHVLHTKLYCMLSRHFLLTKFGARKLCGRLFRKLSWELRGHCWLGHLGKHGLKSGSLETPGQAFSSGVPRVRKMRNSWSISLSPGNRARLLICGKETERERQREKHIKSYST